MLAGLGEKVHKTPGLIPYGADAIVPGEGKDREQDTAGTSLEHRGTSIQRFRCHSIIMPTPGGRKGRFCTVWVRSSGGGALATVLSLCYHVKNLC